VNGDAFGRLISCYYGTKGTNFFWPPHRTCYTSETDYSANFESEKHSFTSSKTGQGLGTETFEIHDSPHLDFIPLDVLTEFPELNGIIIKSCKLPTLKSGLFKSEFNKIEYLRLDMNEIEVIEPKAFEHLNKLKWISLEENNLQTLSYKIFKNNPDLKYVSLYDSKIHSIHPSFFDGLQKLKLMYFDDNICTNAVIGCKTCVITQADLKSNLQKCFDNCKDGSDCNNAYLAHEN
jgi:hypothetical protein